MEVTVAELLSQLLLLTGAAGMSIEYGWVQSHSVTQLLCYSAPTVALTELHSDTVSKCS